MVAVYQKPANLAANSQHWATCTADSWPRGSRDQIKSSARHRLSTTGPMPQRHSSKAVHRPSPTALSTWLDRPRPLWLRVLCQTQRGATVATGTLAISVLALYSSTVGIEGQVNQQMQQLSAINRDRHQLTTANEVLKHHMAEEAKIPATGLKTPHPNTMLFVQAADDGVRPEAQGTDDLGLSNQPGPFLGSRRLRPVPGY